MDAYHFLDRKDAGQQLTKALESYRDTEAVVYALPRGGVPLGYEVSTALNLPLDLVITRKVTHPQSPEYAVCAVTENGTRLCNQAEVSTLDPNWLEQAVAEQQKEAARRRKVYLKNRKHINAKDKIAILVDDGIATGLTIRTALTALKKERPAKLIVAVPVAPQEIIETLKNEADEVVVLDNGKNYIGAVGAYYRDFPQLSDEEVTGLLSKSDTKVR